MDERFQFDREKFKDAVHYVVHFVTMNYGSSVLGNTKLHKILYYADMLHFLETGHPLTGADYLRQRFGPTARHLGWSLVDLQSDQRIAVTRSNYHGYSKSDYASLSEPPRGRLSNGEIELLEELSQFVCAHTATEISDFTHDDVWASVPMGARIPYYASFAMFPAEITDDDIDDANLETARLAPMVEAQVRDGKVY